MTAGTAATPDLPPEARLLLLLADAAMTEERVETCRDLLEQHREDLDWGRLVDLAGHHKILPLVGHNLTRHQLLHGRDGALLLPYHYLFTSVLLANRLRNHALTTEFARVLERIDHRGARYAVRKGPVVLDAVYPDHGARRMTDLDLLVHTEDIEAVLATLAQAGYRQGRVSADGRSVEPFSRRTHLFWRTSLANELPCVRLAGREDLTAYTVDICRTILPARPGAPSPTPDILRRAETASFCGITARRLAPEDHLLDLCAHLYKEATTLYYIENQADLQLQKFVDIAGSVPPPRETDRWQRLVERTTQYEAQAGVFFALHHTELLRPRTVPPWVLDRLRPADLGYLDEYGAPDGARQTWDHPFLQRLFSTRRRRQAASASKVPRT